MLERPSYEALDVRGIAYWRKARVVGELPTTSEREAALVSATIGIEGVTGMKSDSGIRFGAPVYSAFGMTRAEALKSSHKELLLMRGDAIDLDRVPLYTENTVPGDQGNAWRQCEGHCAGYRES